MTFFGRNDETIQALKDEIAGLRADVRVLTDMRDRTKDLRALEQRIETMRMEKARLEEEHARNIRDTEHKVGLLMERQEQDIAHEKRNAVLDVRTENLAKDRERFEEQMNFQSARLSQEIERMERMQTELMKHLPEVQAMFSNGNGRDAEE